MIGRTVQSAEGRSRSQDGPTGAEWWLGFAALVATALVPALAHAQSLDGTPNTPIGGEILWSVVYVLAMSRLFAARDVVAKLLRRSAVLLAFVFLMVLSTLWSVNPAITLKNSVELVGTTLVAYYLVVRYPLPRLLDLFGLGFGTIGMLSLLVIAFAPGHGRMDWGSGAWSGLFQEKNNLGLAMMLAIITLAVSLSAGSRRRRLLAVATLCLCIGLLAGSRSATASTAGIVAIALGFGAWFWYSHRSGAFGRFAVVAIGAVTVSSGLLFGFRPDAALEALGRNGTLSGRTDFWPYLIQAIGDRPLLGYGYNAFFQSPEGRDYLSFYVVEAGGWTPYHAHDSFLQIGLDAGFVGLALLVALLLVALVRGLRYLAAERGVTAVWPLMIVLYLVLGSYTETYIADYNSFDWIFFVVALLYPIRALTRAPARVSERFVLLDASMLVAAGGRGKMR
jgi:exopolysaccharide production protein ExoQ